MNSVLCNKRKQKDKVSLLMADYSLVENPSEDPYDFVVSFPGPSDSLYSMGVW